MRSIKLAQNLAKTNLLTLSGESDLERLVFIMKLRIASARGLYSYEGVVGACLQNMVALGLMWVSNLRVVFGRVFSAHLTQQEYRCMVVCTRFSCSKC